MIAKAAAISHGGNAMRYVTTKDRSDIVMVNHLPDDISPDAMYQRMLLQQKMFAKESHCGRPLMRNMIRIELSPDTSESRGWTLEEWRKLAEEFICTFDGIDMSKRTRRVNSAGEGTSPPLRSKAHGRSSILRSANLHLPRPLFRKQGQPSVSPLHSVSHCPCRQ